MRKSEMYRKAVNNFLSEQSEQAPKLSRVKFIKSTKNRIYFKVWIVLMEGGYCYDVPIFVRKRDLTVEIYDDTGDQLLTDLFIQTFAEDMKAAKMH